MEIRVLGCYGGELPGFRHCSFAVDGKLLLDAGAVTSVLPLPEQRRITNILVTHTHLDHIKGIPFLAANLVGEGCRQPVNIISIGGVIEGLKFHLFNDALWPDFTVLPTVDSPVLRFVSIDPGVDVRVGDFTVRAVAVNHTVQAVGYFLHRGQSTILYTGDTGPTERIWEEANRLRDLKAVLVEASYPNGLKAVAESSGHMTPRTVKRELKKLRRKDIPILLFHMKPQYLSVLRKEVQSLGHGKISFLQQGERYRF